MALQKKVDEVIVTPRGNKGGKTISMRLRCWPEADNVELDTPVVEVTESEPIKAYVGGCTNSDLEQRACDVIMVRLQRIVDEYLACQVVVDSIDTAKLVERLKG